MISNCDDDVFLSMTLHKSFPTQHKLRHSSSRIAEVVNFQYFMMLICYYFSKIQVVTWTMSEKSEGG